MNDKTLEIFSQYGLAGLCLFAILFFWRYRETTTIPSMLNTFSTELKAERDLHAEQMRLEREACAKQHSELMGKISDIVTMLYQGKIEELQQPRHTPTN